MNGLKPFSTGGSMATVGSRSGMILLFFLLSTTTTLVLSKPSFVTLSNKIPIHNYDLIQHKESISLLHKFRGGGSDVDVDSSEEVDSDDDKDDSEELEEESTLTQATKKSLKKKKEQAQKQIKETVSASLASSAMKENKKKKQTLSKTQSSSFKIPYILKALLNPFTVIAMTKGYFASLFNIDYLQEDVSQTLRSALQEKAKHDPSGGRRKFTKKFKPGQAKTLSDLPQLNT